MSSTFWYILTSKQAYTLKVHYRIPRGTSGQRKHSNPRPGPSAKVLLTQSLQYDPRCDPDPTPSMRLLALGRIRSNAAHKGLG
jgi:hypothetical protein